MKVYEAFRRCSVGGFRVGLDLTEAGARAIYGTEMAAVHDVRQIDIPVVFLVVHDPDGYDRSVSTDAVYSTYESALAGKLSPTDAIEIAELK